MSQHIWSELTVLKTCVVWSSSRIITSSMIPKWPHHLISLCHSPLSCAIILNNNGTSQQEGQKHNLIILNHSVKTRERSHEVFRLRRTTPSSVVVMTSCDCVQTLFMRQIKDSSYSSRSLFTSPMD